MIRLVISLVLYAVALYATANVVPGLSIRKGTEGFIDAFMGGVILAAMNATIRPILGFFALPLRILTLGLFSLVVMGFTFWLMTLFVPGIKSNGFIPCIFGAVVFGVLSVILHFVFH